MTKIRLDRNDEDAILVIPSGSSLRAELRGLELRQPIPEKLSDAFRSA